MNITLRSIGLFGMLLFGALLSITLLSPKAIEKSAKGFVVYQIEKEVREKQTVISNSNVASKALNIAEKLGLESNQIKEDLKNNLPEKIANVIASMCGYDCEKKKALTHSITTNYIDRLKSIKVAQDTLGDVIKGKYIEIVSNLKLDLRIFLGSNFVMFLILLTVSFVKPKAMVHLFLPALLLLLATLSASAIYLFGQDWFYTILYNDYMGFGYLAYLSVIFGLLIDIALNKARITSELINAMAHTLSSVFTVLPC